MLKFEYCSLINAPVDVVWNFHERKDILQLLTPPWQPVQIVRREGGLDIGAITEFRILLGPVPIRWIARHIECKKYKLFTDQQIEGPMQSWIHRHQFLAENGQTRLTDSITYEIPGGWLSELLLGWWVDSRLQEMFCYRHQITEQECKKLADYQFN